MTITPEQHANDAIATEQREQLLITEARFFEENKDTLRGMFVAMGREDKWSEDPTSPDFLDYIRKGWIGAEHGNSADKDQFTADEQAAAMPFLQKLGLVDETLPPENTHFDDAIVIGGTMQANYRREAVVHKAVQEKGVTTDKITLLMGQRPREARDGTNEELMSSEGRFAGHDITDNGWVNQSQSRGEWGADNAWGLTETEFGRIAMNKLVDGNLQPHRINLELVDLQDPHQTVRVRQPDVPGRPIKSYEFTADDGQDIVIINAPAVDRGEGRPARHTTRSTTVEWLQEQKPPKDARVLYVSSNPHTMRTAQDTYDILKEMGRDDITLVIAGASAPVNAPLQLFLGEVGRLIDNDVQRNYGVER